MKMIKNYTKKYVIKPKKNILMTSNTFVLPLPIEIHFIIFKFEHELSYKKILEELIEQKCKRCDYGFYNLGTKQRLHLSKVSIVDNNNTSCKSCQYIYTLGLSTRFLMLHNRMSALQYSS